MQSAKIALTGGTSATALWIAKTFNDHGRPVEALCSKTEAQYIGIKKERLKWLKSVAQVHFNLRSENDGFINWILENKPQIWIHHHHHMTDYREQNYDIKVARKMGLNPLATLVDALKKVHCKGVIYSTTYFEPRESGRSWQDSTPYSISKAEVGAELEKLVKKSRLLFSKVVIPDPTGPLENQDRFLPQVLKKARSGQPFHLNDPRYVSNHISLTNLSLDYYEVVQNILKGKELTIHPKGLICTQSEWLRLIQDQLLKRLSLELKVELPQSLEHNQLIEDSQWTDFWNNYVQFEQTHKPWS